MFVFALIFIKNVPKEGPEGRTRRRDYFRRNDIMQIIGYFSIFYLEIHGYCEHLFAVAQSIISLFSRHQCRRKIYNINFDFFQSKGKNCSRVDFPEIDVRSLHAHWLKFLVEGHVHNLE